MEKKKLIIAILTVVVIIVAILIGMIFSNKKVNTYQVTFDTGVSEINNTVEVDENGNIAVPENPIKAGHVFSGWYYGDEKFDFSTKITQDITLTAKWIKLEEESDDAEKFTTCTVEFNVDGGSAIKTQTIESGKVAVKPTNPTKKGYVFKGWYLNDEVFNFSTKVTKNIVLVAKWEKEKAEKPNETEKVVTYTVKFETDGGTTTKSQSVEKNKTATKVAAPTKAGYIFKGWYLNGKEFNFATKITQNITLTAKWEKIQEQVKTYTVTFNVEGGSTVKAQTVEHGKTASKPAAPTKAEHTFKGWYLNGVEFDFATTITQNTTLTAKWEKVQEPVKTYTVTFNAEGGSTVKAQTVEHGKTASKPAAPTKAEHTFKGWYLNDTLFSFSTKITSNITLVAKWEKDAVITWKPEATLSDVGQIMIFVYKDGVKVDATVDLVMNTGKVVKDQQVPKTGRVANSYKVVDVINIRVK